MSLITMTPKSSKEERLQIISEHLAEMKHEFAGVLEAYENDGCAEDVLDTLTEALDAMEDAYDAIGDILEGDIYS